MFLLKKILAALILPPAGPILLALFGLWLLRAKSRRWQHGGAALATLSLLGLLVLSLPVVGNALMAPLEPHPPIAPEQLRRVQAIVILGGGSYFAAPEYGGDTVSHYTLASAIAAIPEVRAALKERQRAFRVAPGLVADGRDMGTVIFPDADCKVFLTASAEERARRRHNQLKGKGVSVIFDGLLREILARDARDAQRTVAPLKPAEDAVLIDTTGLSIDEVVDRVLALVPARAG